MAKQKQPAVAAPAKQPVASQPSAEASNGEASDAAKIERERTLITEFTLKLQRHKDVPTVPTLLDSIEAWAKEKGYLIDKKETSTPGYYSWAIHTPKSLAEAQARANNVMKEVRSLREDDTIKSEAAKLGITPDELLKRALANVRAQLAGGTVKA